MTVVFSILAYVIAIAVSVPLLVLAAECFLALLPPRKILLGERKPCAVLIPAHNEELGLADTLKDVRIQLGDGDRLVVVADNCTDSTAQVARCGGAEVVIRDQPQRRGKGYALDAGVAHLRQVGNSEQVGPEVVVILDADCTFAPGTLDLLARVAADNPQHPWQARYLMHAPEGSGPATRVSAFAFLTKNRIRPRGLDRLGLSVPLTGSGMAFSWHLIEHLPLATSAIVEDLQLGLHLVRQGHGPRYCDAARVNSQFPESASARHQQRTRWEHGSLGQMRARLPHLLRDGFTGNISSLVAFLDLVVPPLSLLVITSAITGFLLTVFYWLSGQWGPLAAFLTSCSLSSSGLAAAWYRFGRKTISPAELLWVPIYALGKIALYARAAFHSESEWKRTERSLGKQ